MKTPRRIAIIAAAAALVLAGLASGAGEARQFRRSQPIPKPGAAPDGFRRLDRFQPIDRRLIEQAIREMFAAWNTHGLEQFLADEFFDKARLLDAIAEDVPRDARIRVLSFQSIQILDQFVSEQDAAGALIASTVSVFVRTQVEFSTSSDGFQRREGTNEFIMRITLRARRR